jgi:two-component system, sensor histidine kinase and response regulator
MPPKLSCPLRVLVVEDNAVNQRLFQAFLQEAGHTPVLVSSAREGLAALERETFDAVLMDLEMPEMDGIQAAAAIRAREASAGTRTPILAVTAHTSPEHRQRCFAAGMDGYISKPVHYQALIEQIERTVSGDRASLPATGLGERKGLRKELTGLFIADALRLQTEMREAVERRDGDGLRHAAHTLQGTAGLFTAQRVCDLARRLEELGREGDFSPATERALQELAEELARLESLQV